MNLFPDKVDLEKTLADLTSRDIERIKKLSASKIALWENCPMAFYQRYIVHEKIPEHIRLAFGKSIHHYLNEPFYGKKKVEEYFQGELFSRKKREKSRLNWKSGTSFANSWSWYFTREVAERNIKEKRLGEKINIRKFPTFTRKEFPDDPDSPYILSIPEDPDNPTKEEGFFEIGDHITFGNFVEDGRTYLGKGNKLKDRHPKVNYLFDYIKNGKIILERCFERHRTREPPVYREERRIIDLFGHETIVIFDRIDKMPNGDWSITDYKTSKAPPSGSDIHRSVQFTIYSLAARKLFQKEFGRKESAIYNYHLRTGQLFKTARSETDFIYLEKLLDSVADGIDGALRTGNFIPHYDHRCSGCDFLIPCEKYSPSYGGPRIIRQDAIKDPVSFDTWEDLEEFHNPLIDEQDDG